MYTVWKSRNHYMLYHLYSVGKSRYNHIGGVMVNVFASNVVDRGFEPRSGQTKDYEIGISSPLSNQH